MNIFKKQKNNSVRSQRARWYVPRMSYQRIVKMNGENGGKRERPQKKLLEKV